jgi:hypothetical protein
MNRIAGSVKIFFIKIVCAEKANRGQKFDEELLKRVRVSRKGAKERKEYKKTLRLCVNHLPVARL